MPGNESLHAAMLAKEDEFYTQFDDIVKELSHYTEHFRGKTVLCNCDDPYESNFFKYFARRFVKLGLKKLICTCWNGSPIMETELFPFEYPPEKTANGRSKKAYKIEIDKVEDLTGDGSTGLEDVRLYLEEHKPEQLIGNGDFRSPECVELLKEADIVVTNPPFSLFHEYVAQLMRHNKKFIIIGNHNAVTYKDIFPLIQENKLWLGVTRHGTGSMWFIIPEDAPRKKGQKEVNGVRYQTIGTSAWFTNLDHKKRHEPIDNLCKRYYSNPNAYPKYDNYDAIEVSKVYNIPIDYDGVMGVPITFLGKYCPEQFEILGCTQRGCHEHVPDTTKYDEYREMITATDMPTGLSGGKTNENAVCLGKGKKKTYFINSEGRMVHSEYQRIFIRKKQ